MKDWIIEFLDAQIGKIVLGMALIWTGWSLYSNRYQPLEAELTDTQDKPVFVEVDTHAKLQDEKEVYYVSGGAEPYTKAGMFIFVSERIIKNFNPVDLDIPPISVKRPPMILPSPGPSLEGSDKLPRFGDEFTPPTAADMLPAATPSKSPPAPK